MKKRFFLLFLIMTALPAAFFLSVSAEDTGSLTAEDRFLNDLLGYAYQSEQIYGSFQWTMEAFVRFDRERSWENLQRARAALTISQRFISNRYLPEQELSFEDQLELLDSGVDVSFMESTGDLFSGEKNEILNVCRNLRFQIMNGVFRESEWDLTAGYIELWQEIIEIYLQYLANEIDWSLTSINKEDVTTKFNALLAEYCPLIHAHQSLIPDLPEINESATNDLLNRLDVLVLEQSQILGAGEESLNNLSDTLSSGDLTALAEDLTDISGMPPVLFYPEWFDFSNILYYWEENDEVVIYPTPEEDPGRMPDGCQILIEDVSKEDFLAYVTEVEEAGLPSLGVLEEDGEVMVFYEYGDSSFSLLWEENSVTIMMLENPICFVPGWYLPASTLTAESRQKK